jgi:DHA3 family macrolide efflux protein-like MFS transporter
MAGVVLLGIGLFVLGMTPASLFWLGVATFFVIGLVIPLIDGPTMAIVQGTVAPEMQGRVLTTMMSLLSLTSPISLAVAGPVADWLGLKSWYFLAGALCIVAGVAGFAVPVIVNIEENANGGATSLEKLELAEAEA